MRPWYYLQRRISAGAKFPPSPDLKLSHRGGCGELVQNPRMQMAVWKRLLPTLKEYYPKWKKIWQWSCVAGILWRLRCLRIWNKICQHISHNDSTSQSINQIIITDVCLTFHKVLICPTNFFKKWLCGPSPPGHMWVITSAVTELAPCFFFPMNKIGLYLKAASLLTWNVQNKLHKMLTWLLLQTDMLHFFTLFECYVYTSVC